MVTNSDFTIGQHITFSLHSSIGSKATWEGDVAGITAGKVVPASANSFVNHTNIYPTLPEADRFVVEDDYTSYNYLMLIVGSEVVYIGLPWIVEGSIQTDLDESINVNITPPQGHTSERLVQVLKANGYSVNSIS